MGMHQSGTHRVCSKRLQIESISISPFKYSHGGLLICTGANENSAVPPEDKRWSSPAAVRTLTWASSSPKRMPCHHGGASARAAVQAAPRPRRAHRRGSTRARLHTCIKLHIHLWRQWRCASAPIAAPAWPQGPGFTSGTTHRMRDCAASTASATSQRFAIGLRQRANNLPRSQRRGSKPSGSNHCLRASCSGCNHKLDCLIARLCNLATIRLLFLLAQPERTEPTSPAHIAAETPRPDCRNARAHRHRWRY